MRPSLYVSPTESRVVRPAPTSVPCPPTRYEPGAFEGAWGLLPAAFVVVSVFAAICYGIILSWVVP